jgi:chromosomal replication initiator protein
VLVIDDVQMIAGKRSSQQELLETFDAIAAQGGQVLLACDAPPRKLLHLHQQLQNRFSAGLVVRVDPPDMETRVSILHQEVIRSGVQVPPEVLRHIADTVRRSVRELLGTLVRVVAECELSGTPVTMLRTRAILEPISAVSRRRITIEDIVVRVASRWGVPPEEILSRSRTRNTSMARSVVTYLARILTDHSLAEIGEQLGGRSHATTSISFVMHLDGKLYDLLHREAR